jgi:hypothetical protein
MRKDYKLSGGKPNPYVKRMGEGGRSVVLERFLRSEHFVRLDDDVAEAFEDDAAVNEALRLVLRAKALPTRSSPVRPRRGNKKKRSA